MLILEIIPGEQEGIESGFFVQIISTHDLPGSFILFGLFAAFFFDFLLFSISLFAHSVTLSFFSVFNGIGDFTNDFLCIADGKANAVDSAADHADTDVDDEYSDDGDSDGKDAKSGSSNILYGFHDTFSFRMTKQHIVVLHIGYS